MKLYQKFLIGALLLGLTVGTVYAATLQGFQGGTGIATSTAGNVGNFLQVASTSPFLTYTFAAQAGAGFAGNLFVSPSSSVVANNFPYYLTNGSSTVSATSTLSQSGTQLLQNGAFNASGTITQNGVAVLTASAATTTITAQGTTITGPAFTVATSGPLVSASVSGQTLTITSVTTSSILTGYTTSTYLPIQWYVANESPSNKDAGFFIFRATSTIKDFWGTNNTSGTVTFNVGFTTSTANATSTWRKIFTADQTIASVTSTNPTVNGTTTVSTGDIVGYYTSGNSSSTAFGFTMYYTTP